VEYKFRRENDSRRILRIKNRYLQSPICPVITQIERRKQTGVYPLSACVLHVIIDAVRYIVNLFEIIKYKGIVFV